VRAILESVASATSKPGEIAALLTPFREQPDRSAVFCDIDGTLAPIVERAAEAEVPRETRGVLDELADRYSAVGCISGRRAVEARELVGLESLIYIGNHGFERLVPGEARPRPDPALGGHEDAAAAFCERHLEAEELEAAGLRIEDKGPIKALHWRGADDEATAEDAARRIAAEAVGWSLVPHWGRKVLEIRPAVNLDKGTALAELLEERRLANALYGGDDRTDVDAFRKLHAMRTTGDLAVAACIGIASAEGPQELANEADAMVAGPAGFLEALRVLAE
jgi:trehalose 6-phosphate phosphatase